MHRPAKFYRGGLAASPPQRSRSLATSSSGAQSRIVMVRQVEHLRPSSASRYGRRASRMQNPHIARVDRGTRYRWRRSDDDRRVVGFTGCARGRPERGRWHRGTPSSARERCNSTPDGRCVRLQPVRNLTDRERPGPRPSREPPAGRRQRCSPLTAAGCSRPPDRRHTIRQRWSGSRSASPRRTPSISEASTSASPTDSPRSSALRPTARFSPRTSAADSACSRRRDGPSCSPPGSRPSLMTRRPSPCRRPGDHTGDFQRVFGPAGRRHLPVGLCSGDWRRARARRTGRCHRRRPSRRRGRPRSCPDLCARSPSADRRKRRVRSG